MNGWIGVDLDGTLAEYHGWRDDGGIGDPIPAMVDRVRSWIAEGREVRIFTARVGGSDERMDQVFKIQRWCVEHIGHALEVTCCKDFQMVELWDDRVVQVELNTGRRIGPEPVGTVTP